MLRTFFTIILLIIFTSYYAWSQSFRHYQVESGLSNNAIMCSIQDKMGFMWFGTRDGLNRFDGHNFKSYHFKENNLLHALTIDEKGNLFVATEKNVYRYEPSTDSFNLLFTPKNFFIDKLIADNEGNLWFNASGTISCYNIAKKRLMTHEQWNLGYVSSLCKDENGFIWMGTSDGKLKKYDKISQRFDCFDIFSSSGKFQSRAIMELKAIKNKILVGTFQRGFGIFDQRSGRYRDIPLPHVNNNKLIVRCFMRLTSEEVWIGSETGIYKYNLMTGQHSLIKKNSGDRFSLSDDVIYSMTKDSEGGVWVGTYFGGLNYYPEQYTPFKKLYRTSSPDHLSGDIVRDITQDDFGNLWICTEDGGVNKVSAKTGMVSYFQPDGSLKSISYKSTHGILAVGNEIWVGTFEHGLNVIDIRKGNVIRRYSRASDNGFNSDFPFCLYKTRIGKILVGTDNGLYSYNHRDDQFTLVPDFPNRGLYTSIIEDAEGSIWASLSGSGLYVFDQKKQLLKHFNYNAANPRSIISDKVNSIFKDSENNVWIATESGLCRWDPSTQDFSRYDTKNGFPSNFILSILEDGNKKLWISTTKGLVCFNPQNAKVITYTTANGLLSDQFNFNSAFKAGDNTMYFGSSSGLVSFNPDKFRTDTFVPVVYITALHISGKGANPTRLLPSRVSSALFKKSIVLDYDQSSLDIEFSALAYTAPEVIRYAYKLDGLSDKWNYIEKTNKLNFPKLATGDYVFKIRASSTSGFWNDKITTLKITIRPPWWESRMAFLLYALTAMGIIYYAFNSYRARLQEKNQRHLERLEIAREKEVLEAKIDFYTEVAHEIRTPLTLIKIPLAKIIRHTQGMESIANSLRIIGGNTDRLIELSNQLLDFRQAELKRLSFNFQNIDVIHYLKEACENFSEQAEQNQITLTINVPENPVLVSADSEAFKKIVYNLLSNAIKYAERKISISFSCHLTNEIIIYFKNDGLVIPAELQEKIFEPFFRLREVDGKTGSGIGLALARSLALSQGGSLNFKSEQNQLNVFYLILPLKHN